MTALCQHIELGHLRQREIDAVVAEIVTELGDLKSSTTSRASVSNGSTTAPFVRAAAAGEVDQLQVEGPSVSRNEPWTAPSRMSSGRMDCSVVTARR